VDWFTSNQDQNDRWPYLFCFWISDMFCLLLSAQPPSSLQNYQLSVFISSNTFRRRKWFVFVIICNQLLSGSAACRGIHLTMYLLVANTVQWGRYWYLHMLSVFIARPHLIMSAMRDMAIPSVRPSVGSGLDTLVLWQKVSSKFFLPSDSHSHLFGFLGARRHNEIRTGSPLGGSNACYENCATFGQ